MLSVNISEKKIVEAWPNMTARGSTSCSPTGCHALPACGCFRSGFALDQFPGLILGGIPHAEGWECFPATTQHPKQPLQRGTQGVTGSSITPLHNAGHSPGAAGLCNNINNHEHRVVYMYVSAIAIISSMGSHLFLLTKAKSIPEA